MAVLQISLIICTYNGWSKGYLCDAIGSVLNQSYLPAEIILVDDGSTDNTATYVRDMFPSVKVIYQENRGLPAARNTGVSAAVFEWIAFLDDDDIWLPQKMQMQADQILNCPDAVNRVFASRMAIFSENEKIIQLVEPPLWLSVWPASLISCPVTGPSGVVINKRLIELVGSFNASLAIGEDFEFWARVTSAGATIVYSREVLLHYRIHLAQMTAPDKLLRTILSAETAILPLTLSLPTLLSNKIRWLRLMLGARALLKRRKIIDLSLFLREFPKPRIDGVVPALYLFIVDSLCRLLPYNFLSNYRNALVTTFTKPTNQRD